MPEYFRPEDQTPIEYDPSHIDRVSGAIGRMAMRMGGHAESEDIAGGYRPTNEVIDDFVARGFVGAELHPQGEAAKRLETAFNLGPQLDRPLYLPNGLRGAGARIVSIKGNDGPPVKLPVRNFVYASAMEDWNKGRGDPKYGDTDGVSSSVIRQYARKGTPMPPIGHVAAYVQPDGMTLFSSVQDGGHRLAAAHLRGDPSIEVGGDILVHRLDRNVLPRQ